MRRAKRTTALFAAGTVFLLGFFGLFILFFHANVAHAANACVSTGTGNWSATSTWTGCGGVIPTSADSVTILTGHIIAVDTAAVASAVTINVNAAAGGNGISINAGRSLSVTGAVTLNIPTAATTDLAVDGGALTAGSIAIPGSATANRFATVSVSTGTVTVSGSVIFSGSAPRARYTSTGASLTNIGGDFGSGGTLTTTGTGTFNFNGSVAQVIGAYPTYNNVQINNTSGDVTVGGTTTIGGTLSVNTGTLDMGAVSPTVVGATTVNSTLRISSITGTKTLGDLTVANGGSLTFTAPEGLTLNGNLTLNGSGAMSGTTGTFVFQKVGGGTIDGTSTSTVTVADANFNTNYSNNLPFTVSGTTTVGAGTTLTNTGTFTATGALNGTTGTFTQGVNGILNIGQTSNINTLNATAIPNQVHYIRTTGAQAIKNTTYHDLFIEEGGQTGTLGGTITVNANLSVVSGTLADGGFQITGNANGLLTMTSSTTLTLGIATAATSFPTGFTTAHTNLDAASTVNYNSNLAQTISNVPAYGNLTTTATAAATKTAAGNLTVNGNLTNGNNNILADGGFAVTVKGGSVMTGTHTGTGEILFTGGSAVHTVSGTGSYNNVELNDVNGVSQSGATNIVGTFTVTSGSWTPSGNNLTVTGDTSVSGTIAIVSTAGTKTFGNITINSGGSMSFSAAEAVTVNGNMTVNGTGAITGTTGTWTFQKVGGGSISGTTPSLTIAGGVTFATAYSILLPFTVNTMTVSAGVNEINAGTVTVNNSLAGTGTFTQSANTILKLLGATTVTTLNASANSNEVHYTSTSSAQTVKAANYYHLFIDKAGQTATLPAATINVLGNLNVTAGVLTLGGSVLNVTGASDIHGTLDDVNNAGSATFGGLVTVFPGGGWTGNAGEACNFNFQNGFVFNGATFTTGPGLYTFLTNNQSIGGSSAISVKNLVVTGIQLTNSSTASLAAGTALSGTGELIQGANAVLNIGGTSAIATLTATANGNSVNYTGTAAQTVKGAVYRRLDVSGNTAGSVSIVSDTTANTALTLGSTIFSTGSSTMIMGPGATLFRTSGFINGSLQKNISTGSPAQNFEIGSGVDYAPAALSFNAITIPGNVRVTTTPSDHPNIATSHLFPNKTANRFWTVSNSGVGFTTYDATFTFVPTDVDAGANPANFVLAEFSSSTWTRPALGVVASTSVSGTGLASFGDFQIGEPNTVSVIQVNTSHADGTFTTGEVIDITVHYSDVVAVQGGVPSLALNSGGTATYLSGGGTDTLTFRYTVLAGENSADLDYASTGALSLDGATIKDAGGDDANNTLPSVGTFAGVHAIVINAPTPLPPPAPSTSSSGGGGGGGSGGRIVPLIGLLKVPAPLALPRGSGSVTYTYTVWNVGGVQALTDVTLTDDKCSPVVLSSGDGNANGKLDPRERWLYSCTTTLSTTTTNTAIATGHSDDVFHQATVATAIATVVVASVIGLPNTGLLPPLINIVKVPSRLTPFPFGGGNVTYSYTVTNPGVVSMSNVMVADNTCSPVSFLSGDANGNGLLDPGEIWTYDCHADVPVSTTNIATAQGTGNGFTALAHAPATVLVSALGLPNTGSVAAVWTISRNLHQGDVGNNVTTLQRFLISKNEGPAARALSRSRATGYFGFLTRAALAEFQANAGIVPASGNFGPLTRAYVGTRE